MTNDDDSIDEAAQTRSTCREEVSDDDLPASIRGEFVEALRSLHAKASTEHLARRETLLIIKAFADAVCDAHMKHGLTTPEHLLCITALMREVGIE